MPPETWRGGPSDWCLSFKKGGGNPFHYQVPHVSDVKR